MYSEHFVLFIRRQVLDVGSIEEGDGENLFLLQVLVLCVRGLPRAQRAPVASHLVVSSCRPVYWLNR